MIRSMFDNDLYKLKMAAFVYDQRHDAKVTYEFINRNPANKFDDKFLGRLRKKIDDMRHLRLTEKEHDHLDQLPLNPSFINYFHNYNYDPSEINLSIKDKQLKLEIAGYWRRSIFWEVPLLALISETYFETTNSPLNPHISSLLRKKEAMGKLRFCEFGTRRRRNFDFQKMAVDVLKEAPGFLGTSNIHLAQNYNIEKIGTCAHEFIQASAGEYGYALANKKALTEWNNFYPNQSNALPTDTFGSDNFFESFDSNLSNKYVGVRQDSGDPLVFLEQAISHYESHKINPKEKTIFFSDGLNPAECQKIDKVVNGRIKAVYCIGTNFTNDVVGSKALSIVIKLNTYNGKNVVKLSDNPEKSSGNPEEVAKARRFFNV